MVQVRHRFDPAAVPVSHHPKNCAAEQGRVALFCSSVGPAALSTIQNVEHKGEKVGTCDLGIKVRDEVIVTKGHTQKKTLGFVDTFRNSVTNSLKNTKKLIKETTQKDNVAYF